MTDHELMNVLDKLVEDGHINEHLYTAFANKLKSAHAQYSPTDEAIAMAPLLVAEAGDWFTHHTAEGDQGGRWLEEDTFEFLGRADGSTRVPRGWYLFAIVSKDSPGICQEGSNTYAGCNGGMLDAIGAWPLSNFRNYKADGSFDDTELALPAEKCWGFRAYVWEESET